MKTLLRLLASLAMVSGLAGAARASTLGIAASPAGYAYWETFASSTGYPAVTITDAAPSDSDPAAFSATLSASMSGSTPGGGDRIYSGTGATGNAFNLHIAGTANAAFDTFSLQLKATGPLQNVALEDNIAPAAAHFGVAADDAWGAPVQSYLGASVEGGNTFYIYAWTWTGLDVGVSDPFTIDITSAAGHVSVDAIRLDAAAVPEPSTYAAFAGAGVLLIAFLRRRRA